MISRVTFSAALLATWPIAADACRNPAIELLQTERHSEAIAKLPIVHPYQFHVIYRLAIPDVLPGDIVQVAAQFEATSDLRFIRRKNQILPINVMLGHFLALGPDAKRFADWTFIPPAWPATENITPDMRHSHRTLVGAFEVTDVGEIEILLVAYAASSRTRPGDALILEYGYGGLSATVFRCDAGHK